MALSPLQQEKKRLAEERKAKLYEILKERRTGGGGRAPTPVPPLVTVQQAEESLKKQQLLEQQKLQEQQVVQQKLREQQLAQQKLRELQSQQRLRQPEVYDPRTKTYVTAPYGMGAGGTAIMRQPTREEQIKIDLAQKRGEPAYHITGYSKKDVKELTDLQDKISTSSETLNKNIENFDNKYKDSIKNNEFIGTTKNIETFENKYKDLIKGNEFIGTTKEHDIYTREYKALIKQQEVEFKKYQLDYNKLDIEKTKIDSYSKRYEQLGGYVSEEGYLKMPPVTIREGLQYTRKGLKGEEYKKVKPEKAMPIVKAFGVKVQLPAKVPKVFAELGVTLVGAEELSKRTIWGEKYKEKTPEQLGKRAGILGTVGTWAFFSPLMRTGAYTQQEMVKGEMVDAIDESGQIVRMSLKEAKARGLNIMTRAQATGEFSRASLDRQVGIIKTAFSKRVYLDEASLSKDILQATKFMKESGLSSSKIKEILKVTFPDKFVITTPVIHTIGGQMDLISTPVMTTGQISSLGLVSVQKVRQVSWVGLASKAEQAQKLKEVQVQKVRQVSWVGLGTKLKQTQVQIPKQIGLFKTEQAQLQKIRQVQRQAQLQKQAQQLRQVQRQAQLQKQIQRQALQQAQAIKTTTPIKTKIPFKLGEAIKRVQKIAKEKPELFSVFVTKFGKEVEIGIRKTKKEAEKLLKEKLFGTLRAGGGIKVSGKKLKAEEIELGFGFVKSKVDPFKIIEKKERRLKRGTQEVPEIQFFRGKKKGLKKKKGLFGL